MTRRITIGGGVIDAYKFKKGDKVKIRKSSIHYGQCDDEGIIINRDKDLRNTLQVDFNNGYTNWYNDKDLELIVKKQIKKQNKLIQYKPGTKIGDYVKNLISKEKDKERLSMDRVDYLRNVMKK